MKKMKKILAMLLALTMVLGMSLTSMAAEEDKLPEAGDTAIITVDGVESGAVVVAYKLIEATYDNGLTGYDVVDVDDNDVDDYEISDIYNVTAAEATTIANSVRETLTYDEEGNVDESAIKGLVLDEQADGTYKITTNAGLYLILVYETGVNVYNPMNVSLSYNPDKSGTSNQLQPGFVDAETGEYTYKDIVNEDLVDVKAYAKSSGIVFVKEITTEGKKSAYADDAAVGDTATFKIVTEIPDYSDEYSNVTFTITDNMDTSLDLTVGTVSVTVENNTTEFTDACYSVVEETNGFMVSFSPEWVVSNPATDVVITYSAVLDDTASIGIEANDNTATLTYTSEPNKTSTKEAATKHYTFKTNGEIIKTGVDTYATALPGATFKLINTDTKKEYVAVSDPDGKVEFTGLDEGTYTLVETIAPNGYTINEEEFTVVVTANYDEEIKALESYDVTINDQQSITIPNTKLNALPSTGGIGTTIFTVAGCGIMIAAAFFFFASRKKEN